ncbi:MAG: mannose-1-phosphate guanylyltransferase/mannose-6-phosphate isomerase [Acidimicrobiia bacterium]|nr:mannose-1-phosphate guanylyltransferase/mannose-6-phosphate isomerase [Acidimicrobiia bacterium]
MIVPVILSGGAGTRLWPLSRPSQPKQLLAMVDERTMLRATFDRLDGVPEMVDPWVVCNADHRHLVGTELFDAGYKPDNVILEPVGRNTAPAAAAAAIVIAEMNPDALMLLLPADHVMQDEQAFHRAVAAATEQSAAGALATFGIVPTYPETGYGYIQVGEAITDDVSRVARFVEKPDFETAQRYLASGEFLWNSGMFLFSVSRYIDELARLAPGIVDAVSTAIDEADRTHGIALDASAFASSPSDSIDFAVMEHTDNAVVVPLDAGWSDVGSWSALWELAAAEGDANVFLGDVAAVDVTGSYLRSESRLVAAIGVDNLVVVETPDAVMVAPRDRTQDVKQMVDLLRERERPETEHGQRTREPWGTADSLIVSPRFDVRILKVDEDSAPVRFEASQWERSWAAVSGTGSVELDGQTVDITGAGIGIPAQISFSLSVVDGPMQIVEITRKV